MCYSRSFNSMYHSKMPRLGLKILRKFIMEHPYRFGLLCTLLIATAAIYIAPSCTTVKHINPPIQLSDDKTQLEVNTELLSEIETVLKENVNSQAKEAGVK